jgi:hypothetical protein
MEFQKPFEQLTDKELLELTQDQIDWYIKLKKAEAGIRIVVCPETPEYRQIPDKDFTLYEVCGYHFEDRETAEEIARAVNGKITKAYKVDYDYYRGGSDHKYAKPYEGNLVDVNIVTVYKKETYFGIKDILISNKKIEDAYKDLKNEYDQQEEASSEIVEKIYGAIIGARERKQQYEEYLTRIQEYLRLSNGDTTVAWNFFEKAYTIEPTVKNRILESEEYINAVAGY